MLVLVISHINHVFFVTNYICYITLKPHDISLASHEKKISQYSDLSASQAWSPGYVLQPCSQICVVTWVIRRENPWEKYGDNICTYGIIYIYT